ncbi:MAG: hypothetical protein ACOC0R_01580 [Mariniphaga sp.]
MIQIKDLRLYLFLFLPLLGIIGCLSTRNQPATPSIIETTPENGVKKMEIDFQKGKAFNYPSFAVWVEDMEGNYIETLYVTSYVASGKFRYAERSPGKWKNESGEVRRASTLPYWAHKRNQKAPDGLFVPSPETAVPDALTSATPKNNFTLATSTSYTQEKSFRILMEINQPWDSNEYWTNSKNPGEIDYIISLQPAIVYAVTIDPEYPSDEFKLNPIGHSHPSGANGKLFTDLTTLTSAKEIAHQITVRLKE